VEGIWLKLVIDSNVFVVGMIYRPPSDDAFFDRFHVMWLEHKNVVIVGDFNCDYAQQYGDLVTSTTGKKLQTSLLQFDYTMVNNEPTRVTQDSSTLIDLVIASKTGLISSTRNLELGISDHMLVFASVQTRVRKSPPRIVRGRTFKMFNQRNFISDLEEAPRSVCSAI